MVEQLVFVFFMSIVTFAIAISSERGMTRYEDLFRSYRRSFGLWKVTQQQLLVPWENVRLSHVGVVLAG